MPGPEPPHYEAVLFDWMLTLADYPPPAVLLERAAALVGRSLGADRSAPLVRGMEAAKSDPAVIEAMVRVDCSVDEHRLAEMLLLRRAGFDDELAEAYYSLSGRVETHPLYAEVPAVLSTVHERGVRVVVVSDIHVDLRAHAEAAGIAEWIDEWVLSFEHGVQKPDPAFFELALAAGGAAAERTLMVGDRAVADGAASALGMDVLILPARRDRDVGVVDPRLSAVLRLVG